MKKEVQAPANYSLNPTVFTADIEFAGQVVKLNVTDPVITAGVSIKKTGYAQTMNNDIMRWTVSGVRNEAPHHFPPELLLERYPAN